MKFEVLNKLGVCVMSTEYESCVYDLEDLKSMAKAGYSFRVDGKQYSVPVQAKKAVETSCNGGTNGCNKGDKIKSKSTIDSSTSNTNNEVKHQSDVGKVKIRCVETGELFDKQSHAAKHYGIDPASVSDSIKTGRPRAGYTFEKVTL